MTRESGKKPCEDAISRTEVLKIYNEWFATCNIADKRESPITKIKALPPVTPQYTDAEIQKMQELEQTEIKKAYELDKADILEKIRAEIETKYGQCDICEYFENYDYEENDISEYRSVGNVSDILAIINKYKAESEG